MVKKNCLPSLDLRILVPKMIRSGFLFVDWTRNIMIFLVNKNIKLFSSWITQITIYTSWVEKLNSLFTIKWWDHHIRRACFLKILKKTKQAPKEIERRGRWKFLEETGNKSNEKLLSQWKLRKWKVQGMLEWGLSNLTFLLVLSKGVGDEKRKAFYDCICWYWWCTRYCIM